VYPGNSGGPLLDKFGNIVGVIVGRIEKLQNVNFAIKSGIALNFLASNRVNPQEGAMVTELRSEEIADRANSFTVRVLCSSNASSAQETDQALPEKATTSLPSRLQFDHYVSDLDPNGWNWLALRNGPSTSAQWSKTVQVGLDTPVKILDQSGEFSRIQLRSGEMGWVTSKYLACCRDDGEDPTYHFVTNLCLTCEDGWLALRRDPSPEGPFSQQPKLKSGAVLSVIGRSQGYYKVRLRTGETGWVTSDHVGCCR
jgi:SH3-like domain-containing protein